MWIFVNGGFVSFNRKLYSVQLFNPAKIIVTIVYTLFKAKFLTSQ